MQIPTWLADFVATQIAAQSARDASLRKLTREAGGMRLFGTIGAEVFLRPDGTTVSLIEGESSDDSTWSEDSLMDHYAALAIGKRHYPELAALLPVRPPQASDCTACVGTGSIRGIVCARCSGLGWPVDAA